MPTSPFSHTGASQLAAIAVAVDLVLFSEEAASAPAPSTQGPWAVRSPLTTTASGSRPAMSATAARFMVSG